MAAFLLLLLVLGTAWPAAAQDTPRVQVFGGYSYTRFDSPSFGFSNPSGLNGYNFSPAFNLIRGFGVVAELSGQYGSNLNLRDIAVGPQFLYPKGKALFFGHALIGSARSLVRVGNKKKTRPAPWPWAEAWTSISLPASRCAYFRWIICTPVCFRRPRTICAFQPAWFIAGAGSRRGTGRPLGSVAGREHDAEKFWKEFDDTDSTGGLAGRHLCPGLVSGLWRQQQRTADRVLARNAYVAVPQGNAIAAFRVNSGSGDLTRVLGSPFAGWDLSGGDRSPPFGKVRLCRQPGRK